MLGGLAGSGKGVCLTRRDASLGLALYRVGHDQVSEVAKPKHCRTIEHVCYCYACDIACDPQQHLGADDLTHNRFNEFGQCAKHGVRALRSGCEM